MYACNLNIYFFGHTYIYFYNVELNEIFFLLGTITDLLFAEIKLNKTTSKNDSVKLKK